jgi:hypothetical protein
MRIDELVWFRWQQLQPHLGEDMTRVWLTGVGILGPGLDGWEQTRAILQRRSAYVPSPVNIPEPAILPPRDHRRCSNTVSLALHTARQTAQAGGVDLATTPSVFANSAGDGEIVHRLLSALAKSDKPVSPTDFHNSVHNASAFYWSLGTGCHAASTSIAAARFSFAAGLLKAAIHSVVELAPTIMVCFDSPLPAPMGDTYPIVSPLAVGFALWHQAVKEPLASLELSWMPTVDPEAEASRPLLPELKDLCHGNPAGRALPLLEAIAHRNETIVAIPGAHDAVLRIDVKCP